MPVNLNNFINVSATVHSYTLTSFTIDTVQNEMIIAFDELDTNNNVVKSDIVVATGQDFVDAMTRASQKAAQNPNVAEAVKTSVYETILILKNETGTII